MQKEQIKMNESCVFEGMTSIRAIIKSYDEGTNDRRIEKIIYDKSKFAKLSKELGYLKAVSPKYGFELFESTGEEIDNITLGTSHGGIIAIASKRNLHILDESIVLPEKGFFAMIQGIEDPYNFGYSLRSLYAMGTNGIILPPRNWMSAAGVVCRSSAGASELFEIYKSEPEEAVAFFKSRGYKIVCAEEKTENILGKCSLPLPLLLVVGGEKRGISRAILDMADILVKIDYGRYFNASLSAASATTIFAYEIYRQNKKH